MRACLVSARVVVFGNECADRERGLDLLVVRAVERLEAFDLDLDFVMESSEVMRRHPPHHLSPRPGKTPAGPDPEARLSRPKSPQQRSNQARKPVISEQDGCSLALMSGLSRESYCTVSSNPTLSANISIKSMYYAYLLGKPPRGPRPGQTTRRSTGHIFYGPVGRVGRAKKLCLGPPGDGGAPVTLRW
jgi:hypothetical protein